MQEQLLGGGLISLRKCHRGSCIICVLDDPNRRMPAEKASACGVISALDQGGKSRSPLQRQDLRSSSPPPPPLRILYSALHDTLPRSQRGLAVSIGRQ